LTFGVAVDAIAYARRGRRVGRAPQVFLDEVAGDLEPARVARCHEIAAEVAVEYLELGSVGRQLDVAVNLGLFDPAHVADELLELNGTVDAAALEIDEVCAAAFEIAADSCVARGQGAAREQRDVASHLGARKRAAAYDQQASLDASIADLAEAKAASAWRSAVLLCAGGMSVRGKCSDSADAQIALVTHGASLVHPRCGRRCKSRAGSRRMDNLGRPLPRRGTGSRERTQILD